MSLILIWDPSTEIFGGMVCRVARTASLPRPQQPGLKSHPTLTPNSPLLPRESRQRLPPPSPSCEPLSSKRGNDYHLMSPTARAEEVSGLKSLAQTLVQFWSLLLTSGRGGMALLVCQVGVKFYSFKSYFNTDSMFEWHEHRSKWIALSIKKYYPSGGKEKGNG